MTPETDQHRKVTIKDTDTEAQCLEKLEAAIKPQHSVCENCGKELEYGRHCPVKCKPQHTPTPWGYTYDESSEWSVGQAEDPQGMYVCNIWDRNDERARANAAFIVRACNAYQGVLEGLQQLEIETREAGSMADHAVHECVMIMLDHMEGK